MAAESAAEIRQSSSPGAAPPRLDTREQVANWLRAMVAELGQKVAAPPRLPSHRVPLTSPIYRGWFAATLMLHGQIIGAVGVALATGLLSAAEVADIRRSAVACLSAVAAEVVVGIQAMPRTAADERALRLSEAAEYLAAQGLDVDAQALFARVPKAGPLPGVVLQ